MTVKNNLLDPVVDTFNDEHKYKVLNYYLFFSFLLAIISLIIGASTMGYSIVKYNTVPEVPVSLHWSLPYTFNYPLASPSEENFVNKTVSFTNDGIIDIGGGISVKKHIYKDHVKMQNLKSTNIGSNILVTAGNNLIRIFVFDNNDQIEKSKDFELKTIDNVADLVTLHDNLILIMGSQCVIPFEVNVNEDISIVWGTQFDFDSDPNNLPYMDTLDNNCFVITHIYNNDMNATVVCESTEKKNSLEYQQTLKISHNYNHFGVAGMNGTFFVVAYSGLSSTSNEDKDGLFFVRIIWDKTKNTLKSNYKKEYLYHLPLGAFDFDNINSEIAIMTFVDSKTDNGLVALMIRVDPVTGNHEFGTYYDLQDGGASGEDNNDAPYVTIRILSDTRFGVFYSNYADNRALCYIMCEITSALDIIQLGPEFILTDSSSTDIESYSYAETYSTDSRFFLIDSYTSKSGSFFQIHIGEVHTNPIGICIDQTDKYLTIAIAGVITVPIEYQPLTVGKLYYTNLYGQLIEGPYFGTDVIEGITSYITTDNEILSMNNLVGYAATTTQLYVETKESLN